MLIVSIENLELYRYFLYVLQYICILYIIIIRTVDIKRKNEVKNVHMM